MSAAKVLKFTGGPRRLSLPPNHWPHVGELIEGAFTIPDLDYPSAPYPRETLTAWADARAASDPEVAGLLRFIVASKPALNAVNPDHEATVNGMNITLHYLIVKMLAPKKLKRYRPMVAELWGVKASTVKDVHGKYGPKMQSWLTNLIEHIESRTEATQGEILLALANDLADRAAVMGKEQR